MKKYVAELIGTFFLVLTIGCTVVGHAVGALAPSPEGPFMQFIAGVGIRSKRTTFPRPIPDKDACESNEPATSQPPDRRDDALIPPMLRAHQRVQKPLPMVIRC